MNVPEVYNDEEEKERTHPKLLGLAQGLENSITTNSLLSGLAGDQLQHRRSVLGKELKQVTWKQDLGRINANDSKVRVRHLETVKARIIARHARTTKMLGRE
jgi:hypothetical protein